MKIDPHVHSSGASLCSKITFDQIIENKKALGYGGAVLTNHCQSWYFEPNKKDEWCENFINEWLNAEKYARERGFKLFFGVEVTVSEPLSSDWLLYGATPEFLIKSPCLYQLSQKQLFDLCNENGIFLVQAHPFRFSPVPAAAEHMHGVEINCTPRDYEQKQKVIDFAREHNLLITCGTDYHFAENKALGGVVVPDDINNACEFANYLKNTKSTTLLLDGKEFTFEK